MLTLVAILEGGADIDWAFFGGVSAAALLLWMAAAFIFARRRSWGAGLILVLASIGLGCWIAFLVIASRLDDLDL